jgi:hypothetical protein
MDESERVGPHYGMSKNMATAQSASMSTPMTIRPCRMSCCKSLGASSSVAFGDARGPLASPSRSAPSETRCRAPGACPGSARRRRGPRGLRACRRSRHSPIFTGPTPTPSSRASWCRSTANQAFTSRHRLLSTGGVARRHNLDARAGCGRRRRSPIRIAGSRGGREVRRGRLHARDVARSAWVDPSYANCGLSTAN